MNEWLFQCGLQIINALLIFLRFTAIRTVHFSDALTTKYLANILIEYLAKYQLLNLKHKNILKKFYVCTS